MVYAREAGERQLTFQVSGKLWNRSLVMRDVETGSLWSHILGTCMEGVLKGEKLEVLGGVMTTWDDWKSRNPGTTVLNLPRTSWKFHKDVYAEPQKFVLGIVASGTPKAFPLDVLTARPVLEAEVGDEPVVAVFDPESTRALVFRRRHAHRTLRFEPELKDGLLVDRDTESGWDPLTGKAVRGELKGSRLEALPAIVSYRRSWQVFHPESEYAGGR